MGDTWAPARHVPNGVENPVWAHHILQTRQHRSYAANLSQCAHVTCYETGDTWTVEAREVLGKEYICVVCRKVNFPPFFSHLLSFYTVWKTYWGNSIEFDWEITGKAVGGPQVERVLYNFTGISFLISLSTLLLAASQPLLSFRRFKGKLLSRFP